MEEERVTLFELLTSPKFRKMSDAALSDFIDSDEGLSYDDWETIPGEYSEDKAKTLRKVWEQEQSEYPKRMLVWDNNEDNAEERIVVGEITVGKPDYQFYTVRLESADRFNDGKKYDTEPFKYAKELPVKPETIELTMDEIADKFGVDVKTLKIKKC